MLERSKSHQDDLDSEPHSFAEFPSPDQPDRPFGSPSHAPPVGTDVVSQQGNE